MPSGSIVALMQNERTSEMCREEKKERPAKDTTKITCRGFRRLSHIMPGVTVCLTVTVKKLPDCHAVTHRPRSDKNSREGEVEDELAQLY